MLLAYAMPLFPQKCCLWNMQHLEEIKKNDDYVEIRNKILQISEKYAKLSPIVITVAGKKTFALDIHYYCTSNGYYWYNSWLRKYVRRDGELNPEKKEYDNVRFGRMAGRLKYLCAGYFFTGDVKYYNAYIRQLKAWFIDKKTWMYPNLEYSQVIPGENSNRGVPSGVIEGYFLNNVMDSYRLLVHIHGVDNRIDKPLKKWFEKMYKWMQTSSNGKRNSMSRDNTSIMQDVLMLNIALFLGNKYQSDSITKAFKTKRLDTQISSDGSQPWELKRSKSYSYSVYNLTHIIDFCIIQESQGNHYYQQNKRKIDSAANFLSSYMKNSQAWKYQQITPIEDDFIKLQCQLLRLQRLSFNKKNRSLTIAQQCDCGSDIMDGILF